MDYTNLPSSVIEKFWSSIEKTDNCWNWLGPAAKRGGAPLLRKNGYSAMSPRRISLTLAGKTLPEKEIVLPLICNNPICVNPAHLVIGDEARFWSHVQKLENDCWVWVGWLDKDMYGQLRIHTNKGYKAVGAHVYSFYLATGFMPSKLLVCHKCDHPYCVNPSHLFLGTTQDNTKDRDQKGRTVRLYGETNAQAKLTEQKVREIRRLSNNLSHREIAKLYQIHHQYVHLIVNGKRWSHIK